jgi:hypothetical protein
MLGRGDSSTVFVGLFGAESSYELLADSSVVLLTEFSTFLQGNFVTSIEMNDLDDMSAVFLAFS